MKLDLLRFSGLYFKYVTTVIKRGCNSNESEVGAPQYIRIKNFSKENFYSNGSATASVAPPPRKTLLFRHFPLDGAGKAGLSSSSRPTFHLHNSEILPD